LSRQQRAFIDFFEDRLAGMGYDWKQLIEHYLYEIEEPLAYSLVSGCKLEPQTMSQKCSY